MTETIAKIGGVSLGREDHGIFTCMVHLNYGGGGQGAGGYSLDEYSEADKKRHGTAFGCEWIIRLMDACGVDDFSKLVGRTVLALHEDATSTGQVIGLKPLPTERGKPFLFRELADEYRERQAV